jgi:hypothetical protein
MCQLVIMRHDLFPAGKGRVAVFLFIYLKPQAQAGSRITCISVLLRQEQNKSKSLMLSNFSASKLEVLIRHNEMQMRQARLFPFTVISYNRKPERASKKRLFYLLHAT